MKRIAPKNQRSAVTGRYLAFKKRNEELSRRFDRTIAKLRQARSAPS
jgi:hypothetical protein